MKKSLFTMFILAVSFLTNAQDDVFNFNSTDEGFTSLSKANSTAKTDYYTIDFDGKTGNNPTITTGGTFTGVNATTNLYAYVTLRNSSVNGPTFFRLSFPKTGGGRYYPQTEITNNDKGFKTYLLEMNDANDADWAGTVTDLKIHFKNTGNTNFTVDGVDAKIDIDKIVFTANKVDDFTGFNPSDATADDEEGWSLTNATSFVVAAGVGTLTTTLDESSKIVRSNYSIDASNNKYIHVRYKNNSVNNQFRFQYNPVGLGTFVGTNSAALSESMTGFETISTDLTKAEYTGFVSNFQIIVRDTDNTGNKSTAGNVEFDYVIFNNSADAPDKVWNGGVSIDWNTAANWSPSGVPSATDDVFIPYEANAPVIGAAGDFTVASLEIVQEGSMSIASGGKLTVTDLVNNGIFNLNSGASLKVNGSSSGNVGYYRTLGTTNWYLVSSPFSNETYDNVIQMGNLAVSVTNAPNIGIAPYDNTEVLGTNQWDYKEATTLGSLGNGVGYSVKLASVGDIYFYGGIRTDATVGVGITSSATAFNLIGNPYSTSLAANSNAHTTNNLLSVNSGSLTETTMWVWNQADNKYDIVSLATPSFYIAPTQAFFVSSTGSNTFNFTEVMQSNETDNFQKTNNNRTELKLLITSGKLTSDTNIYYIDGTTTGFDNGYDSSIFGGVANSFTLYTQEVENSTGRKLGIQSLPNANYEDMVVPVGIISAAGKELSFSTEALNLPSGIKVFLEDRFLNTFTRLDEANSEYKVTITEALNGIGRFYLHTANSVLNTDSEILNSVSIYKLDNSTLRIAGLSQGKTTVSLYNILGKKVMTTSFEGSNVNTISLPSLATGVYVVKLQAETGELNKKIILE